MTEELKPLPCPFCGSDAAQGEGPRGTISVWCTNLACRARGPKIDFPEIGDPLPPIVECIKAWNTRSPAWRDDLVPLPRDATDEMERVMADTINEILRQLGRDELSNDDARWVAGAAWANGKQAYQDAISQKESK